uniref:Histone deacetylase domain-containing protein n=1 Tax=Tetraodon nigroviridis TaxID=99883 RepID=H3CJQ5_TETNG
MNLAGGKLCAVLEGGYNLTSLPQSVCQTVQTLLGDPAPPPAGLGGPCRSALESIHCVRSAHRPYWSCLKHAAELPTSEISSKCAKLAKKTKKTAEGKTAKEEEVWPEPQKRVCPPIRVALILPDGVNCPEGCQRFSSTEDLDSVTVNKLRENFSKDGHYQIPFPTLSSLFALVDKMEKKEIYGGLALVQDVSMAMMCIVHQAATLVKRVLVVCVGDMVEHRPGTDDGKTLLVQFSRDMSDKQIRKYDITVCLKKVLLFLYIFKQFCMTSILRCC